MNDRFLGLVLAVVFAAALAISATRYVDVAGPLPVGAPEPITYISARIRFALGAAAAGSAVALLGSVLVIRSHALGWRLLSATFAGWALVALQRMMSWRGPSSGSTLRLVLALSVFAVACWWRGRQARGGLRR